MSGICFSKVWLVLYFTFAISMLAPAADIPAVTGKAPAALPLQHRLVMPDTIYAVEGIETNVYFDNVFLSVNSGAYVFDVDCTKGSNFKNKWSFIPTGKDVGCHSWTLSVIGENGVVARKKLSLAVAPAKAGQGRKISLLMIGDSITNASAFPSRVHELFGKAGNPVMTMIGSRAVPGKNGSVVHEGYPGWGWLTFLLKGPFVVKKNGRPELDIPAYLAEYNHGEAPDFITLQLGVNDIFSADEKRMSELLPRLEKYMDTLIRAFRKAAPRAVIGIGLPTPCASQDGVGRHSGCRQSKYQYTENRFMLSELIMRKYQNGSDKNIFVIPMYNNLDCEYNFPMQDYPVNAGNPAKLRMPSDGIHPSAAGSRQLGDTLYAYLKNHLQ